MRVDAATAGERPPGCRWEAESTTETKAHAVRLTLAVPGGILLAIMFGIVGYAARKPAATLIGGLMMILEASVTIFSIGPLAAITGAAYWMLAYQQLLANRAARAVDSDDSARTR